MRLNGRKVAILVEEGFEDLEFWVPLMRLQEEGASVTVVGLEAGKVVRSKSGGLTANADVAADQVSAADFDAVVLPGGWAPDKLRRYEADLRRPASIEKAGWPFRPSGRKNPLPGRPSPYSKAAR